MAKLAMIEKVRSVAADDNLHNLLLLPIDVDHLHISQLGLILQAGHGRAPQGR